MRIPGIMSTLRLKLKILINNPSQIPVMSAFELVKKPLRVRESQFIIKYTWSFNYCNTFKTTRQVQLKFDVEYI